MLGLSMISSKIEAALAFLAGAIVSVGLSVLIYEGIPLGPLEFTKRIPLLGPAIETITDGRVDRERKKALEGYVHRVELEAARAEMSRLRHAINAARAANDSLKMKSEEYQRKLLAQAQADAIEDADYEAKLSAAGRRCDLDRSDVDYIMR